VVGANGNLVEEKNIVSLIDQLNKLINYQQKFVCKAK